MLRSISKRDMEKFVENLPKKIENIDGGLMSKSFNFPFKLIYCEDRKYYKENYVTNEYLLSENLYCIKSGRMTGSITDVDEILVEIF